jgi:LmbE family N-acetylglucosaminyl deacetylase
MQIKDLIPVPELTSARNALVVSPHPDDAELVAGGTVAVLAGQGAEVTYAMVTDGSMGGFDPGVSEEQVAAVRRNEQSEAAKTLGVQHIEWLGFQDTRVPLPEVVRQPLISLIRKVQPDFVISLDPWLPYEAHPDHRRSAMAVVEACLFAPLPMVQKEDLAQGLMPWQVTGIALALSPKPNTYINIDSTWEKKVQAVKCHRSQFPDWIWNAFYPAILAKSQEYGQQTGAGLAEGFKVLTTTHLHVMVDTWRF